MHLKSMLVVIDPTQRMPRVMAKVWRLVEAFHPRVELFVCDCFDSPAPAERERESGASALAQRREELRQQRLSKLEALAAPLREAGHAVSVEATWYAPLHEGIVRRVLQVNPDLVIKESHVHQPVPRETTAHTDWLLARDCPAPLLLVKRLEWPERLRITVAVDPCRPAERPVSLDQTILDASGSLARGLSAQREVFHVFEGPAHLPGAAVSRESIVATHERAREAMRKLLSHDPDIQELHYLEGDAATAIPGHTQARAYDILVLGMASRSRPLDPVGGGSAARTLEAVSCDVLVIKPEGFVSPMLSRAAAK